MKRSTFPLLFSLALFPCTLPYLPGSWEPLAWQRFVEQGSVDNNLPDFAGAGYHMGDKEIPLRSGPLFNVTDTAYGAIPDDGGDDTEAIQKAIEAAGKAGGGVVFLPRGRYEIRKDAAGPYLRIRHDAVVVRGEGNGEDGTVLHLGSRGPDGTVRRLGSVPAAQEPLSGATLAIIGPEDARTLARVTTEAKRGERILEVSSTAELRAGMQVVIRLTDPAIDTKQPRPERADLVRSLTQPYVLQADQVDTFGSAGRELTWITRIERVHGMHTIELAKAARLDQPLRYQPTIVSYSSVREVGIEDIRITSAWPGGYRHHKAATNAEGDVIRSAREQDYLWNGIWISHATDTWVRNVSFADLTQGVIIVHSADLTISNVLFHGQDGHAGITLGRSNDVLISDVDFHSRLVHPLTVSMMAFGNVVSNAEHHVPGRDEQTSTDSVIDFHGIFPFENLFENLRGFYVCSGGDESVLPHAGVRNVFWNIKAPESMECFADDRSEFARTWAYDSTSSKSPKTMMEHYPQSFFIGLYREHGDITIAGETKERYNTSGIDGYTVEGLNRNLTSIPSLYRAQRELRLQQRRRQI